MIKIFTAAVVSGLLFLLGTTAAAQNKEFSLSAGAGVSGLNYSINKGTRSIKPGFQAGVGYTHFLNTHWGIATGLELGYCHTKARLDPNTVFASYEVDSEGNAFEYRVKTKAYQERQNLYAVNIPLLLQFQSSSKHKAQFYSLAGVKLSLPVSSRYKTHADEISAAGYYPDVNAEITNLPAHGFGTLTNWKKEGAYNFNLAYALSAEAGTKLRLSTRSYLYAGLYVDYGLNDLKKEQGYAALLTYHPTALDQSQATGAFSLASTTGEVSLLAYGIKLRMSFSSIKKKKAVKPLPVQNELPVQPLAPVKTEEQPKKDTASTPVIKAEHTEKPVRSTFTEAEEAILKRSIHFSKVGDTTLSAAIKTQADSLAAIILRNPHTSLVIEGHTCELGNDAINSRVGRARANSVATYFKEKGIDAARLQVISKGADEPLVPNTTEANRKLNRRVVIKVSSL